MLSLIAALFLGLATQVTPPPPASVQAEPETRLADIVVDGTPEQARAQRFVHQVMAPPPFSRAAVWDRSICVSVVNMKRDAAQAVIDSLSEVAMGLGLQIGAPGCKPDVVIVASVDGAATAKILVDENRQGFRPALGGTDRGGAALETFQTSEAPVRWWHVSATVMADTGRLALPLRHQEGGRNLVRDMTRLRSTTRDELRWTVIVVDLTRVDASGATFGALSDYLTMVALAQINPEADWTGQDTVLNLFGNPAGTTGFSERDRDFLSALYDIRTDQPDARSQDADLIRQLAARAIRRASGDAEAH